MDDILVFCNGQKRGLKALMCLFKDYAETSSQFLSLEKCKFYCGNLTAKRSLEISEVLGFSVGNLPFSYLDVPLFKGKPRRIHLQPIMDRIKLKFASWKGLLLSIMGWVQLVKSVIHGILTYSFHIYAWPISLLKIIDRWIRNFIWSGGIQN